MVLLKKFRWLQQFNLSVVFACILALNFSTAWSWSANGHRLIANIAYEKLQPAVRANVDKLIAQLNKDYPGTQDFIQLAVWPDSIRSDIDTFTRWHYINLAISADSTPLKDLIHSDNAVWAIEEAAKNVGNKNLPMTDRARFLAFLVHIVGDIHQPLHSTSLISAKHPDGDRGGNDYKIDYRAHKKNVTNLHSLWDSGAGAFDFKGGSDELNAITHEITAKYNPQYFGALIDDLSAYHWAVEGKELAPSKVYNTPETKTPSAEYILSAQQTAEQRAALAGYRLAAILNKKLAK